MSQTPPDLCEVFLLGERTSELSVGPCALPALEPHRVSCLGCSWARPPYRIVRHGRELGQILLTRSGVGRFWCKGEWHDATAGTALLSPPFELQAYYAPDSEHPWEFVWVAFHSDADLAWPLYPALIEADPEPLWSAVYGLHRETQRGQELAHMAAWAELITLTVRRILRGQGAPDPLRRVWEAVERDLARPWTVTELADIASLSSGQLRVVSHQSTGRSPMEQVTYLRMQRAGALLLAGDISVEQAASVVGYASPFAFSTAFKRVMGVPPSRYRH